MCGGEPIALSTLAARGEQSPSPASFIIWAWEPERGSVFVCVQVQPCVQASNRKKDGFLLNRKTNLAAHVCPISSFH